MTPVRIIGIGSPHGADAAGWWAVRNLQQSGLAQRFPVGRVSLANCAVPVHLYPLVVGCRLLVIIDAVPGDERQILSVDLVTLDVREEHTSLHGLGVADMVELLQAVSERPLEVLLFAIPVADGGSAALAQQRAGEWTPELSRRVEAVVQRFLRDDAGRSPLRRVCPLADQPVLVGVAGEQCKSGFAVHGENSLER